MIKVGKVQTIDMNTGEVKGEKVNAMTMLPPPGNVCQECAVDHPWNEPHNQESLYYQYHFHGRHGRWPTWSDAMAHCDPKMKEVWREELVRLLRDRGLDVPADLVGEAKGGR